MTTYAEINPARSSARRPTLPLVGIVAATTAVVGCLTALPSIPDGAANNTDSLSMAVLKLEVGPFRVAAALLAIAAVLVAIIAAGARRHLDVHAPSGSSLPRIAFIGLIGTAIGLAAASAGAAQLGWVIHEGEGGLAPAAWNVVDTVPFASFMGIGLAAGAFAVAVLRHGAGPRWFGLSSAVLALAIAGLVLASLPFIAFAPGGLWLALAGFSARS